MTLPFSKAAFVEALPTLTGLATGYGPGRSVAGETAAAMAPQGRVHRSEAMARNAAVIGAPLGGLVAMGLARKYGLVPKLRGIVGRKFPQGLIAEPAIEEELVNLGVPGVAAITGSLAGGGVTGGLVGGVQQLRGPTHRREKEASAQGKEASLKPSPMWGTIGGAARQPAWRAQAGFTPTGMHTPAQRLQKSMSMGSFNRDKGLKPLDLGKMQQAVQASATGTKTAADSSEEKKTHNGLRALAGIGLEGASNAATMGLGSQMVRLQGEEGKVPDPNGLMSKVRAEGKVPIHEKPHVGNALYIPKNDGGMTVVHNQMGIKGNPREPHIIIDSSFKSPSLLSHELSHSDIDQSRFGRLIQNPRYNKMINGAARPLAALGLGMATGGSEDERVRNAGIAGAGLLSAPNLISEGMANVKGYQRIKRLGASPAQLAAARKTLSAGMGSYVGRAGATMGTALLGSSISGAIGSAKRKNDADKAVKMGQLMVAITKIADDGGHGGFSTNAYSGVMNPPPMVYASGIPGWKEPPVKTSKKEASGLTPASRLASSRAIGAPRATAAPGPSIAQIAKPVGFGRPIAGAGKGNNIL